VPLTSDRALAQRRCAADHLQFAGAAVQPEPDRPDAVAAFVDAVADGHIVGVVRVLDSAICRLPGERGNVIGYAVDATDKDRSLSSALAESLPGSAR
jgi:hypothetical protein